MIQRFLYAFVGLLCVVTGSVMAQPAEPTTIAIFPLRNITGFVVHDYISWDYADSLEKYLNAQEPAGERYVLVPTSDVRDQMLAQNVDIKSPSYENDVWEVAKALGAKKIVWGSVHVKYEKATFEIRVIDVKTLMHDVTNMVAESKRTPLADIWNTIPVNGTKLLPALR